jgi:predicted DNA-binding transcriptional regulator YafY
MLRMSRSGRLLALLQALRRHRRAVSGLTLAQELGISIRTLYRDIAELQAQGAMIEGAPGIGYVMQSGFMLPPLMFQEEELEALTLGLRWVADLGEQGLSLSARDAMAKIAAVLPESLRRELEASAMLVGNGGGTRAMPIESAPLRAAIRSESKLRLSYRDTTGKISRRIVWPFALVYFEQSRVLSAWCELRSDFRNFRSDRILKAERLDEPYPGGRRALLQEWQRRIRASDRSILPESDIMPL